jgi:hypothetical protein
MAGSNVKGRHSRRPLSVLAIVGGAAVLIVASLTIGGVAGASRVRVTLQRISVSPSGPSIVAGTSQGFVATGFYSDGSSTTLAKPKWSSSDTGVATISNKAATDGLGAAIAHGKTTITASLKGVSGSATLTVRPGSQTFSATGSFAIPSGVTSVMVTVDGGSGLAGPIPGLTFPGGAGASVEAALGVPRSIHSLTVVVGQGGQGGDPDAGGGGGFSAFGSGGDGSYSAGGGGGASGIFVGTPTRPDALVVAGGGGGEVTINFQGSGGNGGTLAPGGPGGAVDGGSGASATAPGAGGPAGEVGEPPMLAAAGQTGAGANGGAGGGLPQGPSNNCGQGGGGGGGGYYGGGGGGYCGGGGGGSSFVAPTPVKRVTAALRAASAAPVADGSVTITWG